MVFCFDSNTSSDSIKNVEPKPFVFRAVYAAKLNEDDWTFSGRSSTSRRTITASVNRNGFRKMKSNWIYEDPITFVEEFDSLLFVSLPIWE